MPPNNLPPATTTPAPGASTAPAAIPVSGRDPVKEKKIMADLGLSELQASQLSDNPVFQKRLYEMAYGANASNLPDYQKVTANEQKMQDIQGEMGQIQENAPNAMLALEDALRTKKDVGNQQLGESELFKKAGLEGFFVLDQSLQDQARLMSERYGSFVNALSRAGQYQANKYQGLASHYNLLSDEYNQKREEMVNLFDEVNRANQALSLAEREFQFQKDLLKYERDLEAGEFDNVTPENEELWVSGDLRSADSSDISGVYEFDVDSEWAANCIKWLRNEAGAVMPYGLFTIDDKKRAIELAGVQNTGAGSMDGIGAGDIILTSEGKWGHGARVAYIEDDGTLVLEEANYIPGKVTGGRRISKEDAKILGYIKQDAESHKNSWSQFDQRMSKLTQDVGGDTEREGNNPSIQQQFVGGAPEMERVSIEAIGPDLMSVMLEYQGASVYRKEEIEAQMRNSDYGDVFQLVKANDFTDFVPEDREKYAEFLRYALRNDKYKTSDIYTTILDLNNDFDSGKRRVAKALYDDMSVEQKKGYDGALAFGSFLEELKTAAAMTGDKTGIIEGAVQRLYESIGAVGDMDLAAMKNDIKRYLQAYVKQQSGVAFSQKEFDSYAELFADINKGQELNLVRVETLQDSMLDQTDQMIIGSSGYTLNGLQDVMPEDRWGDYGLDDEEVEIDIPDFIASSGLSPAAQAIAAELYAGSGNQYLPIDELLQTVPIAELEESLLNL